MQIRQRAQGQSRCRTQIPLPAFGKRHPAGNAVPNTAAIDSEQNALATQRLSLRDRDTLARQGMKTIMNGRFITRNVGFLRGSSRGSGSERIWPPSILSQAQRQLPGDLDTRTGWRPVLMETFVDVPRFSGIRACKASGWTRVGTTRGRGKFDRKNEYARQETRKRHLALPAPEGSPTSESAGRMQHHPPSRSLSASCPGMSCAENLSLWTGLNPCARGAAGGPGDEFGSEVPSKRSVAALDGASRPKSIMSRLEFILPEETRFPGRLPDQAGRPGMCRKRLSPQAPCAAEVAGVADRTRVTSGPGPAREPADPAGGPSPGSVSLERQCR